MSYKFLVAPHNVTMLVQKRIHEKYGVECLSLPEALNIYSHNFSHNLTGKIDKLSFSEQFLDDFPLWFKSEAHLFKQVLKQSLHNQLHAYSAHIKALDLCLQSEPITLIMLCNDMTFLTKALTFLGKKYGIPTLHICPGIPSSTGVQKRIWADKMAVCGKAVKSLYTHFGNSEDKIVITGNPYWDNWRPCPKEDINTIKASLGLDTDKKIILYAPARHDNFPFAQETAVLVKKDADLVIEKLKELDNTHRFELILKIHPDREKTRPFYEQLLKKVSFSNRIFANASTLSLLQVSDIVICSGSMIVESALVGKTTLQFYCNSSASTVHYNSYNLLPYSTDTQPPYVILTSQNLSDALHKALDGGGNITEGWRETFIRDMNGPSDGNATERVALLAMGMAIERKPRRFISPVSIEKPDSYYGRIDKDLFSMITGEPHNILEVGCGEGRMGEFIKRSFDCEYTGLEINEVLAEKAGKRLDRVIIADIEETDLRDYGIQEKYFDYIILGDILEHLYDPWRAVQHCKRFLKSEGHILSSISNIRNFKIIEMLASGHWTYKDAGILGSTHLRFFTLYEIENMFTNCGYAIKDVIPVRGDNLDLSKIGTAVNIDLPTVTIKNASKQDVVELSTARFLIKATQIVPLLKKERQFSSIIILTHNQIEYTKKCIGSIFIHTKEPFELIVVDNGSTDGTVEYLETGVRGRRSEVRIKIVKNKDNLGFAKGYNQGIAAAQGDYILLMNNGTVVTPNWLEGLISCAKENSKMGIVGPMTDDKAAGIQSVADYGCVKIDRIEEYAEAFLERNRHRRKPSREISGFCMLFHRGLVERIGPFDEKLGQDSVSDDYCLRATLEGYNNFIAGDVFVACGVRHPRGSKRSFNHKWGSIDAKPHIRERLFILNTIEDAEKLYHREDIDNALLTLIDGIGRSPNEEAIYHRLSEMLIDSGRFKEALDAINSIPKDKKDNAKTIELTGYCKAGMDLDDEAAQCADRALSLNVASAPALNLKGMLAYKRGDKGAAEDFFKKAFASDPGYGDAYTTLGTLVWKSGSKEKAFELLEKGFILSPTVEDSITTYHTVVSEMMQFERGEGVFREAKALYPQNRRIVFLLIDILIRQEKYELAIQEIREAIITFGISDGILSAASAVCDRIDVEKGEDVGERPALSLCMIVKDEEESLARCLMSAIPIVDDIVIVDTGSTDRTKAIAKMFGARVYDFEWTNDFSEARNLSLSRAGGDWILVLDADEVISPLDYDRLAKIVKSSAEPPKAYSITTRNYVKPPYVIGWTCNNGEYADEEDGTGWYPSAKVRLFTNDSSIRFENLIHELVEPSLKRNGIKVRESDIPVHHYGQLDRENCIAKGDEYCQLGKKKLEEKGTED
jgi:GT2 family glycosyltransferase/SAM-dependent methyltransferase